MNKKHLLGIDNTYIKLMVALVTGVLFSGCNSGNSNVSGVGNDNVLGLATNNNKIIKEIVNNLPNNCVVDNVNNPTVETCFYMPNGNGGSANQLIAPSYANYVSALGQGGGGGGGGASAFGVSMYNGGGDSGNNGQSGIIGIIQHHNVDSSARFNIYLGGGGGGGGGGMFNNSDITETGNSGGSSGMMGGYGCPFQGDFNNGGGSGGGGASYGSGGSGLNTVPYGDNRDIYFKHPACQANSFISAYGGGSGGYGGGLPFGGGIYPYPAVGGGGGGGGAVVLVIKNNNSSGIIFAAFAGGNGGISPFVPDDYSSSNVGLGGNGGNSYTETQSLSSFYNGTYKNGGSPRVCDQEYDNCNANDGGGGFAILTLSESPVVLTTNNVTLNFVSPSQNNVCMLIKDDTDDQTPVKSNIEIACSNNGHPVYIKTLAGVGATISATDDGSVIYIDNSSNKSLEFHNPLITNMDTVINERFEYKSVLQEERFAESNPEYKTTVVTSDVRYDPTDPTKVVETKTLTSSGSLCMLTHGNLSCSSAAGRGFALPSGNWINECYGSHYDGVTLTAICGGLTQSQYATPGTTSNCTVDGGSLTCTDKGFNYPSGTSNYEKNLYPYWHNWNFKKDHFGGDILLSAVSGVSGDTSTTLAASGSESYCDVVGVNGFLSCEPYLLPKGPWLNHLEIVSSVYDGATLTVSIEDAKGKLSKLPPKTIAPDSDAICGFDGSKIICQ